MTPFVNRRVACRVVSNNGLKWAICSVRSEGRSVGCSGRPLRLWLAGRRPDLVCWSDGTDAINASETDCLAGHIGLELPNPRMNYLFEVPCQFPLFWVSALENIRV
jgi:hypothetical protein